MTYKLYWESDPFLVVSYREAHKMKFNRDIERDNYIAWLQGFYNGKSFAVAYHNLRLDKKNKHKAIEYLKEPMRMSPMTEVEKAEEKETAWLKIKASLDALKANFVKKERL